MDALPAVYPGGSRVAAGNTGHQGTLWREGFKSLGSYLRYCHNTSLHLTFFFSVPATPFTSYNTLNFLYLYSLSLYCPVSCPLLTESLD